MIELVAMLAGLTTGTAVGAAQLAVAILVPSLGVLATGIWWFHRRVKNLEDSEERKRGASSFFGDGDGPLSIGLAKEVRDMKQWQQEMTGDMNEVRQDVRELNEKIDAIYSELDDDENKD